jgi:hypothetical protein
MLSRPIRSVRVAASGYGVWVLALITATACGVAGVPQRSPTPIVQSSSQSAPAISDLPSLTRQSDLIVVGRVESPGTTRQVAQPIQTPIGPSIGPTRAGQGQSTGSGGISIPIATYTVDVERVARGTTTPRITVTQSGNPIPGAPPSGDDVPLAAGERYVLFLQAAPDGTFFEVGGIQGRLVVDAPGLVHLVGSGSPATRGHDGQSLDAFLSEVSAVK